MNGINNVMLFTNNLCEQLRCKKEELDFKKVTVFTLTDKNILKINCLWPMCNLTRLNLSNNFIKRIENLENLLQLKELNLSFNEISKIENLDSLSKLDKLLLYSNKIEILENLHCLQKLKVLNLGRNRINNKNLLIYLSQFACLKVLIINENPCYTELNETDKILIATLPSLLILNYKRISNARKPSTYHEINLNIPKKFDENKIEACKSRTLHERIFQNYDILLRLSNEGENFKNLNEKFEKKIEELYLLFHTHKLQNKKYFQNFNSLYQNLEKANLNIKKNLILHMTENKQLDSVHEKLIFEKDLFHFHMKLLATECDTYNRLMNLSAQNVIMRKKINEFLNHIKNIHKTLRLELELYSKSMFRNIRDEIHTLVGFQVTSKETNFSTYLNSEFFDMFKSNGMTVIAKNEIKAIELFYDWKNEYINIIKDTVVKYRKAVIQIREFIKKFKFSHINQNDEFK